MAESAQEKELRAVVKKLGDYINSYEELMEQYKTGYLDSSEIGDDFFSEAPDLIRTMKQARSIILES